MLFHFSLWYSIQVPLPTLPNEWGHSQGWSYWLTDKVTKQLDSHLQGHLSICCNTFYEEKGKNYVYGHASWLYNLWPCKSDEEIAQPSEGGGNPIIHWKLPFLDYVLTLALIFMCYKEKSKWNSPSLTYFFIVSRDTPL